MAIKIIKYVPKVTSAKTQYVEIEKSDLVWMQTEFIRYLSLMGELEGSRNQDIKQLMKYWWHKRTANLPKSINGQNSPCTFISGLLNNTFFGTQRDLSIIVLDGIEHISAMMAQFDEAIVDLKMPNSSTSIKFQLSFEPINIYRG